MYCLKSVKLYVRDKIIITQYLECFLIYFKQIDGLKISLVIKGNQIPRLDGSNVLVIDCFHFRRRQLSVEEDKFV